MATPLPSAALDTLRPVRPGNPPWVLVSAQILGSAPANTRTSVERVGVQAFSVFGINIGDAPTPAQIAAGLVQHGQASHVYYIESWAQDGRIIGSGWVTWWFIAVYS